MYDLSTLPSKTLPELKEMAKSYALPEIAGESAPSLMARIQIAHNMLKPNTRSRNEPVVFVRKESTKQQIQEVADMYREKELVLRFPDDDSWHVRCNGSEDSGTIHQSIIAIGNKIRIVSEGARRPRGLKTGDGKIMFTA